MSQRIVNHTLCKAYDTFIWEHQVSSLQLPHELNSLAQRLSKDRRDNLIEFMLELLTLSGRLASFEPLAASLRSNEAKSRGTAIETIEQACSSELKRLLRPLLDAREADRRLPIARELHPLGPGRIRARIIRDTESLDDLEAAFALELLAHLDLNYAAEQSRIRLADFPAGLSHVVGVEVIARAQNEESDSIFQRAGRLMAYAPTKDLDLHTLLELSQADCDIAQNQGKARPSRLLTVSKSEVRVSLGVKRAMPESSQINLDLDTLVERSRRDATLARNLYQLIRTSDGHAVA